MLATFRQYKKANRSVDNAEIKNNSEKECKYLEDSTKIRFLDLS